MSTPQPPQPPQVEDVFLTLTGPINEDMLRGAINALSIAIKAKVKRAHLLIQSGGGGIPDGIALYNFLRNLPFELITYNGGAVSSIAVLAYLAGKTRKASQAATFLIHKSHWQTPPVQLSMSPMQLAGFGKSLVANDERIEVILKEHVTLPPALWRAHKERDVIIGATDAKKFGLTTDIGDFQPPIGAEIYPINPIVIKP